MQINSEILRQILSDQFATKQIDLISEFNDGYAKRTFKIAIDNHPFLFQMWIEPEHLLTCSKLDQTDDIHRQNVDNLLKAQDILNSLSIKTPDIIYFDKSRNKINCEFAIIEYITGGNLFANSAKFTDDKFLADLGEKFGMINSIQRPLPGLIAETGKKYNLVDSILKTSIENIDIGAKYNAFLLENKAIIQIELIRLTEQIAERNYYSLIHGDFKPNHFLFNDTGETIIIDIDGMQFFDVEYEIAQFMVPSFAFSNCPIFMTNYHRGREIQIDSKRLLFYKSCQALSGLSFCSEYLNKYNSKDQLFQSVIDSNEETIFTELIKSARKGNGGPGMQKHATAPAQN